MHIYEIKLNKKNVSSGAVFASKLMESDVLSYLSPTAALFKKKHKNNEKVINFSIS